MWKGLWNPREHLSSLCLAVDRIQQSDSWAGSQRDPKSESLSRPRGQDHGCPEELWVSGYGWARRAVRAVTRDGTGRPAGEIVQGIGAGPRSSEDKLQGQTHLYPWKFRCSSALLVFPIQTTQFSLCVGKIRQISTLDLVPLMFFYPII